MYKVPTTMYRTLTVGMRPCRVISKHMTPLRGYMGGGGGGEEGPNGTPEGRRTSLRAKNITGHPSKVFGGICGLFGKT